MHYTTTKNEENSTLVFTVDVPTERIQSQYKKTLKSIIDDFKMDGFRAGTVPEKMVIAKVGSLNIWEQSLRDIFTEIYIEVLTESKLATIGMPSFRVTKIADQSDATVEIETFTLPEISLPNYTAIAKTVYADAVHPAVTESEIDDSMRHLRQMRYAQEYRELSNGVELTPEEKQDDSRLPELSPDYIAGFGPAMKTVEDMRKYIQHNLEHDKIHSFENGLRSNLVEQMTSDISTILPEPMVLNELDIMMSQFESDLQRSGVTLDQYAQYTNKTREQLQAEMKPIANTRALSNIVLEKIAAKESIVPDEKSIEMELTRLREFYKNESKFNESAAKQYVQMVLTHEAVFEFLEKLGGFVRHDHGSYHNHDDFEAIESDGESAHTSTIITE